MVRQEKSAWKGRRTLGFQAWPFFRSDSVLRMEPMDAITTWRQSTALRNTTW